MQALFKVVDIKVAIAIEHDKIVAVALVVAEKEVLAVLRAILAPVFARDLDGRCLGVFIPRVADVVGVEPPKYFITSFHSAKIEKYLSVVAKIE